MGIWIFLTAAVVEIIFAGFCMRTESTQQRVRSIIRIAAFICFVVFTSSSLVVWSFQYYTLAALLLVFAILGAVALIRNRREKRPYKASRVVYKAIGMTMLIFLVTLPAILFPQHDLIKPTGAYQVATANYSYTDTKRIETYTDTGEYRMVNVQMWFPKDAEEEFPLIVFSPGAFGGKTSYQSLFNELASHGYVVCSIDHPYQCLYTRSEKGHTILIDLGYVKEISNENASIDMITTLKLHSGILPKLQMRIL